MTVRIVLADDQAMIRSGLALVLRAETDLEIVEECADGHALLRAVARTAPDLVLTDVRMPGTDGIEATRRLRALPDAPPVLALTTFDDDDVLWPALDAGAAGFVLKDSPAEALVEAVRVVAGGGTWIDPRVLPRVVARAVAQPQPDADRARALSSLTPRERAVLDLVCDGASNAEIAVALRTAERTVKSHVSAVLAKLGARDRAGAIVAAHRAGWRSR
ncbi:MULTISPECIES: response regulator transcription factor [unclassified Curtobacterium]|uniref:response regulator transcription factor n=1 Tax=unclassified Curtobacterium TaxID=257496 RepID=UPI0008DE3E78|nr:MULTISPECIES: response regulator transcription factor [unclassified Curtobacterium]OIH92715.1 DNA-binding response regulator [Curtobacterium sp. MCBA15_003]OII33359.1 DNA-binding response regulator [Curtobacterium sp. MMLR14_006]